MQLFFSHPTTTRHRLLRLEQHGLISRFRPWLPVGTAQSHWSLDIPGLIFVDADRDPSRFPDESPESLLRRMKKRRLSLDQLAHSTHLTHRVETNSFFTRLRWDERTHDDGRRLVAWINERELGDELQSHRINDIRPDGYGAWHQNGHTVEFFLEHDRGTEPLSRLQDKLQKYEPLIRQSDRPVVVLFALPGERRLGNLAASQVWAVAAETGSTVAACVQTADSPSGASWMMPGQAVGCPMWRLNLRHL
jgi:Replication-relaxation